MKIELQAIAGLQSNHEVEFFRSQSRQGLVVLAVFGNRNGLLLVDVLLLVEVPMVLGLLVNLTSTVFKVVTAQPFTKAKNFLQGLL